MGNRHCDGFNGIAELVAKNIMEHLILQHGCPRIFKSDNASYFKGKVLAELVRILDINHRFGAPYHPESQSCVERINGKIIDKIIMYLNKEPKKWSRYFQSVIFSYNISVHSVTKEMPFRIVYGRMPNIPIRIGLKPKPDNSVCESQDYMRDVIEEAEQSRELIARNTQNYQRMNKKSKDKKTNGEKVYQPSEKVWVYQPLI